MKRSKVKKETKEFSAAVGRAQDRPHAWHAYLHLEKRQSCRRKTVKSGRYPSKFARPSQKS
jgi:hypothetical protein